jgi:aminopeptidase N
LFLEHDRGRDAFVKGLKRSREKVFGFEKRYPRLAVIHDNLSDTRRVLNALVYQKAGWALHMLRKLVGDDAFWKGVRAYYDRHRGGNAATDDFRQAMEETCGMSLGWFFEQWLRRPGSPTIECEWQYRAEDKQLEISLSQTQPGAAYRLPLEAGIQLEGSPELRIEKVEMTGGKHRFEIKLDKAPVAVELDPNVWALVKSTISHPATAK